MINVFLYTETVALNNREIGKNLRIILKFKPLINIIMNITGKEQITYQGKITGKVLRKIQQKLVLMC